MPQFVHTQCPAAMSHPDHVQIVVRRPVRGPFTTLFHKKPTDNLRVCAQQDGHEVFFLVRKTTKFTKVLKTYCERLFLSADHVVFSRGGRPLQLDLTPSQVRLAVLLFSSRLVS